MSEYKKQLTIKTSLYNQYRDPIKFLLEVVSTEGVSSDNKIKANEAIGTLLKNVFEVSEIKTED